jgi:hypothetical protein
LMNLLKKKTQCNSKRPHLLLTNTLKDVEKIL